MMVAREKNSGMYDMCARAPHPWYLIYFVLIGTRDMRPATSTWLHELMFDFPMTLVKHCMGDFSTKNRNQRGGC